MKNIISDLNKTAAELGMFLTFTFDELTDVHFVKIVSKDTDRMVATIWPKTSSKNNITFYAEHDRMILSNVSFLKFIVKIYDTFKDGVR